MGTAAKTTESSHTSNTFPAESRIKDKHWSDTEMASHQESLSHNFNPLSSFFQSKPQVGRIDDPSEIEADQAALNLTDSIYSGKERSFFPSISSDSHGKGGNRNQIQSIIQQKPAFESSVEYDQNSDDQSVLQKTETDLGGSGTPVSDDHISSGLENSRNSGHSLPDQTRQDMEEGFGADFSNVKVHTGSYAAQMSKDLNAQAFTSGSDVYFNDGKYNPGTREGDKLLAHELTHTIQQGAAETGKSQVQTKGDDKNQGQGQGPSTISLTPVDISTAFRPNPTMATYLHENRRKKFVEVPVQMGKLASGNIRVRQTRQAKEGTEAKYLIYKGQGLPFIGVDFLNPLRSEKIDPVIALSTSDPNNITGFVSLRIGKNVLQNPKTLIREINKHLELLGLFGIKPLNVPDYENKVANGVLTLRTSELKTSVAGFLDASGSFGLVGEKFTFELNTHVDLKGLAQGDFKIERKESGKFEGEGEIAVAIKNVSGKVKATYAAGDVTILGTVGIESEKFSGSVTIMVADKAKAKQTMMAELGVETLEEEKKISPSQKSAKKKTKKNQVVIGWGTVTARITPWLEGTAKVGMDEKGQVTIVGTIVVPNEVELMEQKGKKVTLLELEIKAGYGIPLVGQVGLFASIGMFVSAGFGPLVLRNVGFEGTYSTDPSVLQKFIITGTLGISAFAIIGLEAKAGVFVTLVGHDVKAGIKVTAAAGIKAYAEVTPTFEYFEKANPEGGKVGEAWLKGHFEAAAQLFLQLAGAFFVEIDAPWWSPVPDKTWEYPLGDVEYPLGPSLGIGGDVAWLVGSPEVPELKFSPVDFDPDKFTSDIMADPPPGKGGGKAGKQKGEGKWEDKSEKAGKEELPDVKKGKGLEGKKKQDFSKLPEQQRYMRALGELGDLGDSAKSNPVTFSVLAAKVKNIKRKYALQQISIKDKEDSSAKIYVKQGKYTNGKKLIKIKLISEAERQKLVQAAIKDLESRQVGKADPKAQTMKEADAKAIASEIAAKHPVVESIEVKDGKETWDYEIELGDRKETIKGYLKEDGSANLLEKLQGLKEPFTESDGDQHTLQFTGKDNQVILAVFSSPKDIFVYLEERRKEADENNDVQSIQLIDKQARPLAGKIRTLAGQPIEDDKKRNAELNQLIDELGQVLQKIRGDDIVLPTPEYRFSSDSGRAGTVEVYKLSKNRTGGTPPGNAHVKGWSAIKNGLTKGGGHWKRLHLINQGFGGFGTPQNLVPGTASANSKYDSKFDKEVKKSIGSAPQSENSAHKDNVVWIEVKVTYGKSGPFPDDRAAETGTQDDFIVTDTKQVKQENYATGIHFKAGEYPKGKGRKDWKTDNSKILVDENMNESEIGFPDWSIIKPIIIDKASPSEFRNAIRLLSANENLKAAFNSNVVRKIRKVVMESKINDYSALKASILKEIGAEGKSRLHDKTKEALNLIFNSDIINTAITWNRIKF